jgi:hypothetical protein
MIEILKCLFLLSMFSSGCKAQLPEFDRVVRTENGCQVIRSTHELKGIPKLPDSILCRLSNERVYYKYVQKRKSGENYDLIYSADSLVDGSATYLEIVDYRNDRLNYLGKFGAFLPRYFQSYSQEYISSLPLGVKEKYNHYGFYPIRKVSYSTGRLIFSVEAFNGLGYRFEYKIDKGIAVCEKTNLAQFSNFYEKRAPASRSLFVGRKLNSFNYSEFYEYFEITEDL